MSQPSKLTLFYIYCLFISDYSGFGHNNIYIYIEIINFFQGILDLIVTTIGEDNQPHIHLLQHVFTDDAFFLKVKGRNCMLIFSFLKM